MLKLCIKVDWIIRWVCEMNNDECIFLDRGSKAYTGPDEGDSSSLRIVFGTASYSKGVCPVWSSTAC
jgi:hypothetical protein